MRKFLLISFILLLTNVCLAQEFDFKNSNNEKANQIVKDFLASEFEKTGEFDVVSHFADIDKDNQDEILSVFKVGNFHKLRGYKLVVLKQTDGIYRILDSDIYFDINYPINVENKKITYKTTSFYKNKKYKAKVKKHGIFTRGLKISEIQQHKMNNVENLIKVEPKNKNVEFSVSDFNASKQKDIIISYPNLNERTKKYYDMQ